MEELLKLLRRLHPDTDFTAGEELIESGILNSLDIVTLITEINDTFDVKIPAEEISPENFCTAEAIWTMIKRLDEE